MYVARRYVGKVKRTGCAYIHANGWRWHLMICAVDVRIRIRIRSTLSFPTKRKVAVACVEISSSRQASRRVSILWLCRLWLAYTVLYQLFAYPACAGELYWHARTCFCMHVHFVRASSMINCWSVSAYPVSIAVDRGFNYLTLAMHSSWMDRWWEWWPTFCKTGTGPWSVHLIHPSINHRCNKQQLQPNLVAARLIHEFKYGSLSFRIGTCSNCTCTSIAWALLGRLGVIRYW